LAKGPRIVIVSPAALPDFIRTALRGLGYIDGRNIRLEFRDTGGIADRLPALAEQIVQEGGIDVFVTVSLPAALAAHKATQTIPIVAFVAGDPVVAGLAKSLAHPGGNVTGIAVFAEETNIKRVEIMREVSPLAVRLGMIGTKIGLTQQSIGSIQEAARKLGFAADAVFIDDPNDIAKTLTPERLAGFDAFVVPPDVVLSQHEAEVVKLMGPSGKPVIYPAPDWARNGGMISFGPDFAQAGEHLVSQLDRVLKGEKPSDLPFDRPTKFYLSINQRTAQAMGIEIPPALLTRADEVIE
jgi:putative ABC transport system substrate-binding protein